VINLEPTSYSDTAAYDLRTDVTTVLPALVERVLD